MPAIIVMDAASLERNLFLLMQVQEFDIPVVGVINMMDTARKEKLNIDFDILETEVSCALYRSIRPKTRGTGRIASCSG